MTQGPVPRGGQAKGRNGSLVLGAWWLRPRVCQWTLWGCDRLPLLPFPAETREISGALRAPQNSGLSVAAWASPPPWLP